MLKTILIFIFLYQTMLMADVEEFPFIGLTTSINSIDTKNNLVNVNKKDTTFGLCYGKQTLEFRTMFTFNANKDYKSFDVEVDKILLDSMFGTPKIRPYLGTTLGYIKYDSNQNIDSEGYYYGLNSGFIIYSTDNIDIDLSYHYYKTKDIQSANTIQGITMGVHFFY